MVTLSCALRVAAIVPSIEAVKIPSGDAVTPYTRIEVPAQSGLVIGRGKSGRVRQYEPWKDTLADDPAVAVTERVPLLSDSMTVIGELGDDPAADEGTAKKPEYVM